jgi:hypothetical protein
MDLAQFTAFVRGPREASRESAIDAIYATGHWLLGRDRTAEAAKLFRTMILAAPRDERGWLGLGECHERIRQPRIAAELYGAGSVVAGPTESIPSVRCLLARARALVALDRESDAAQAVHEAAQAAEAEGNEELEALVASERRRLS